MLPTRVNSCLRDEILLEFENNGCFLFCGSSEEHLADIRIVGNHSSVERHRWIHRFLCLETGLETLISEVQTLSVSTFSSALPLVGSVSPALPLAMEDSS